MAGKIIAGLSAKDFSAIANAIADARAAALCQTSRKPETDSIFNGMARDVAKVLAGTNPKFDRERFLSACGVK